MRSGCLAALAAGAVWAVGRSPREVTPCPVRRPSAVPARRRCRPPSWRRCPTWPATPGTPTPCTPSSCGSWFAWCEGNGLDPLVGIQRAHVELYIRQLGERGLMDSSVITMMHARPRVLPVRPHRRPHPRRPGRLRPAAEGPPRRVPHPGPGPARADPVPPGRPDHHRPPRRPGLPARHQRPARLRGRRGADRGLRRDPARPPGAAPGRQGQQARHHAAHRPGAARPRGLPRRTRPPGR